MPSKKLTYPIPTWGKFPPTLYQNCGDRNPQPTTWEGITSLIASDSRLQADTAALRALLAAGNKSAYDRQKAHMPAFAPAALMVGGHKSEHIQGLTSVAMVDLDGLDDEQLRRIRPIVNNDPHTFMTYLTSSGHGLRILFRYVVEGEGTFCYTDAWQAGNQYFSMVTDCPYDRAVKDATRLSFFTHDPDILYHPDAKAFVVFSNQRSQELQQASPTPETDLEGYQRLFDLAWQLSLKVGNQWVEGNRHKMMLDLARLHCRLGIPRDLSEAHLAALAPRGAGEARDIAQWCYTTFQPEFASLTQPEAQAKKSPSQFPATSQGQKDAGNGSPTGLMGAQPPTPDDSPEANAKANSKAQYARYQEIGQWLTDNYLVRQNSVRRTFEYFDRAAEKFLPLTENMRNTMMIECDTALNRRVRRGDFDAVLESNYVTTYNPFVDYLQTLPEYDGSREPDYIGQLCDTVHTTSDPAFFHKYFQKWFVSLLPAMLDESKTNQVVLIFTGPQGTYKSTFFRELLPPELRDYFLSKTDALRMDKDARLALSEFALICLEEIGTMTPRELDTIKGIITQTVISERAPYQHTKESRPHIASFCGTSNETELFGDRTGLRRWLAFEIKSIDEPHFNYRGLYSQAYYLYRHDFQYWFDSKDIQDLAAHMEQFKEVNLEEEQILRYYRVPSDERDSEGRYLELHTFVTTAEILERCSYGALRGLLSKNNIGRAMKNLGFQPHSNGRRRGFIVHEIDPKEIMDTRTLRRAPTNPSTPSAPSGPA